MKDKIICWHCKSKNVIKWGKRKTKNRGFIQRYKCKDCKRYFVLNEGFYRMRNSPHKITLCLDLFYKGISTRQIQEHLQAFYPCNSSNVSIYKWIIKYSKQISKFTDKLKIKTGKEIQVDEMEIGSRKSSHRGWFIDCIDPQTKFIVASNFDKTRANNVLKKVLINAKRKTGKQVERVTTDGYLMYPRAVRKAFTLKKYNQIDNTGVEHNIVSASKGQGFNHSIERLHNNIRHRIKTFRGFHGSVSSANAIMKGFEIYYNFIRKHLAIRKRPYELACSELKDKLNVSNKWFALIALSNQNILKC